MATEPQQQAVQPQPPRGFESLHQIISLDVTYITNGYLSVHTGYGDGYYDDLVIREGDGGKPIIPGSTIKGVVRSLVESILATISPNNICVPETCGPVPPVRKGACKNPTSSCDACQLFGHTKQRSRVTFHDAKLEGDPLCTLERHHVAIDRTYGTAAQTSGKGGALATMEAVPGNALQFNGKITFINPKEWMVGAVIETLPLIHYAGLGARKSRGYGDLLVQSVDLKFTLRLNGETTTPEKHKSACIAAWTQKIGGTDQFSQLREKIREEAEKALKEAKERETEEPALSEAPQR